MTPIGIWRLRRMDLVEKSKTYLSEANFDEPSILGNIMVDIPDIGQKVQIEVDGHNGKTTHQGVILHPAASNHLTIKLDNGYNASYTIDEIVSIQVIGKIEEESVGAYSELEFNDQLPRVRITYWWDNCFKG